MKKIKTIIFILFCALVLTSCELNHAGATKHPDNDIINPEVATYTLTLKDYTSNDVIKTITKNVDKVISSSELTFLDKTGFKTVLLNEEEDTIKISDITSTSTVFVKYIPNTYKFVYHESSTKTILDINYEETITSISPKNTPTGKEFLGWSSSSTEFIPYEFTTMPACNVEVYAFYKDKIYNIVLNTNLDIFSGIENVSKYNYGDRLVNIVPQELLDAINATSDYEFAGWYFDQECTKKFNLISMPSHDINLYAKWIYRGLAYYNDSSLIIESTQNIGDEIITPTAPSKPGYIFENWYYDLEYTNVVKPGDIITSDLKAIYAKYTPETNKEYKVEYYQQTLHGAYKLQESVTLTGYTDEEVHVEIKSYNGFTFNSNDSRNILKGNVKHDSVIVLKAYYTRNTYKLTIDSLNDTTPIKYDLLFEEAIPTISTPTKAGHTFNGWNTSVPTTMPAENVELTAIWTINQYTISFNSNGGTEVQSITQDYGTVVTIPEEPTKVGHTFNGWNATIPTTMPAENVELTAIWTINQYTISFDTDGGTEVQSITQDYGTVVTIPENPTKVGHTFNGWSSAVPTTMPSQNVILTAIWTVNKYTISFDTNGGTEVQSITQDYGTAVTIPENPTKVGHTFVNWDKEIPTTMPDYDVLITAIWQELPKYTISFVLDSSIIGTVDNITNYAGVEITLPNGDNLTHPKGLVLDGWSLSEGGEVVNYTVMPSNNVTLYPKWRADAFIKVTSNLEDWSGLYLIVYEQDEKSYIFNGSLNTLDVAYNSTLFTGINNIPYEISNDYLFTINKEDNNGYTIQSKSGYYIGRTTSSNGLSLSKTYKYYHNLSIGTENDETFVIIDSKNSSYLRFNATSNQMRFRYYGSGQKGIQLYRLDLAYNITFNSNDTLNNEKSLIVFDSHNFVTLNNDAFTRENYKLIGWSTNSNATTAEFGLNETITATDNVTLYAVWQENPKYTITFNTDGGSIVESITKYENEVISLPSTSKEGYDFLGWSIDNNNTVEYHAGENYNVTNNSTLYAVFEYIPVNERTITFNTKGGTSVTAIDGLIGETITLPTSNKLFSRLIGWSTEDDNTAEFTVNASYEIVDNVTLYAVWEERPTIEKEIYSDGFEGYTTSSTYTYNNTEFISTTGNVNYSWDIRMGTVSTSDALDGNNSLHFRAYNGNSTYGAAYTNFKLSNITKIEFDAKYASQKCSLKVLVSEDKMNWTEVSSFELTNSKTHYSASVPSSIGFGKDLHIKYEVVYSSVPQGTYKVIIDNFSVEGLVERVSVTYQANDGTNNSIIENAAYGTYTTKPNTAFTREGYQLIGWATSNNATTAEYDCNSELNLTNDITLYAVWEEIPTYTITFNTDGSSVNSITKNENEEITLPSTSKDGYTFLGWSDQDDNSVEYSAGAKYTVTQNATLYAVWREVANITSDSFVFSDLSLPDVKDNQRVWTVGNATFVQDKFEGQSGISNNIPIRIYAGHSVTISSQYAFTSLVFTCSSNSYATALINSIGNAYTVTKNENVVTVTFNTAVTTFTFKCSEQVRLSSLVVNY